MNQNKSGTQKHAFFFEHCKEKFNYLIEEFNFSLVQTRKGGGLYEVIFQNESTAVIVNWELRENWIYIELYRLTNGKLVIDPIKISSQADIKGYHLNDLLSIRYPVFSSAMFPVDEQDVVDVLINYAALLRQYAADVLNGDFTIFDELEKIVKARIALDKYKTN